MRIEDFKKYQSSSANDGIYSHEITIFTHNYCSLVGYGFQLSSNLRNSGLNMLLASEKASQLIPMPAKEIHACPT